MFYGHMHTDDVQVFMRNNEEAVETAYIGPSLSPYVYLNPAYRVYEIDEETKVNSMEEV
jgi:sphingomyelin phosphodiesterase